MEAGSEPIDDDEWLLRTIPPKINYIDPDTESVDGFSFRPKDHDEDGISLSRQKYISAQQLVNIKYSDAYYVVKVKAGDLRSLGMELEPDPIEDNPGHTLVTNLNYENRRAAQQETWQQKLAGDLCEVIGYFETDTNQ